MIPHLLFQLTEGAPAGAAVILRCDATEGSPFADPILDDDGVLFQGFVKSRAIPPAGHIGRLAAPSQNQQPLLLGRASTGVTLGLYLDRDFGLEVSGPSTISLTPTGTEVDVLPKFQSAAIADVSVLQVQVGDSSAQSADWSLNQLVVPVSEEGDR